MTADLQLVADIIIGASGSGVADLTLVGDSIYFTANDGTGDSIWKHSPATGVTEQLVDPSTSQPLTGIDLRDFQGQLVFGGSTGAQGLFSYNPGTHLLSQLSTIYSAEATIVGDSIFFRADDGNLGEELWRYQPGAGVSLVADLNMTPDPSDISMLVAGSNELFFWAQYNTTEGWLGVNNLYRVDTLTGEITHLLNDLHYDEAPINMVEETAVAGGRAYYPFYDIYSTDPTANTELDYQGTLDPININDFDVALQNFGYDAGAGLGLTASEPSSLVALNDKLYFAATRTLPTYEGIDQDGNSVPVDSMGFALDPNFEGTITSFNMGPGVEYRGIVELDPSDNRFEFVVGELETQFDSRSFDIGFGSNSLIAAGSQLLFIDDNTFGNGGLWSYDPSTGSTEQLLADNQIFNRIDLSPGNVVSFGNSLYLVYNEAATGTELYVLSEATAPIANAGGPYLGSEGTGVAFDASATTDAETPLGGLTFEWDLDYDGTTFQVDLTGVQPTTTFANDFSSRDIAVRVTDPSGLSDIAITTLQIANAPPVIVSLPDATGQAGQSVIFSVAASDPGNSDVLTYTWDFGQGDPQSGVNLTSPSHTYPEAGTYTGALTVTDDAGASVQQAFAVVIADPVSFTLANQTVDESAGTVVATVALDAPATSAISVPYTVSGTADGNDHDLIDGTVTIGVGESSAGIVVNLTDDELDEVDVETIVISLGTPSGASLGDITSHEIRINDNDAKPTAFLSTPFVRIEEEFGATVSVTAQLDRISGRDVILPLLFAGSATIGDDFTVDRNSITIPAGSQSATAKISLINDITPEPAEIISVSLQASDDADLSTDGTRPTTQIVTIPQNDQPQVWFSQVSSQLNEGDLNVSQYGSSIRVSKLAETKITIPYTLSGDTDQFNLPTSGTLTIPAGRLTANLVYDVVTDDMPEAVKSVRITLGTPTGAVLGPISETDVVIYDDDIPELSLTTTASSESFESVGDIPLHIALDRTPVEPVEFSLVASSTSSLTRGADYVIVDGNGNEVTGSLTLTASEPSMTRYLRIVDDELRESTESLNLKLKIPGYFTTSGVPLVRLGDQQELQLSVRDNDPEFRPFATPSVNESDGTATFGVELIGDTEGPVAVSYVISGAASQGSDFAIAGPTHFVLNRGETATRTVTIIDDLIDEPRESISLKFSSNDAQPWKFFRTQDLRVDTASISIVDNDLPTPKVYVRWVDTGASGFNLTGNRASVQEGSTAKLRVELSRSWPEPIDVVLGIGQGFGLTGATPGGNSQAGFSLQGSSSSDGSYQIPAGSLYIDVDVDIRDNNQRDGDRELFVGTISATTANLPGPLTLELPTQPVLVLDNDAPASVPPENRLPPTAGSLTIDVPNTGPITPGASADLNLPNSGRNSNVQPMSLEIGLNGSNGFIAGGTVFFDANFNGVADYLDLNDNGAQDFGEPTEPQFTTDLEGNLVGSIGPEFDLSGDGLIDYTEGRWMIVGGTDTSKDLPLLTPMTAPPGMYVINGVSTLVSQLIEHHGHTIESAKDRVAEVFDLSAADLGFLDNVRAASVNDQEGNQAVVANAQIMDSVNLISRMSSALPGAPDIPYFSNIAFEQIASLISADGSTIDFGLPAVQRGLIAAVSNETGFTRSPIDSDAAAAVIAAGNTYIQDQLTDGDTSDLLVNVTRAQIVAQTQVATALEDLALGNTDAATVSNAYTGSNLETLIAGTTPGTLIPPAIVLRHASVDEGTVTIHLAGGEVGYAKTALTFRVDLIGTPTSPVSVDFATQDGTATVTDSDYESTTGTLGWDAGDGTPRFITVWVTADDMPEVDEHVALVLSNPDNAVLRADLAYGYILSDEYDYGDAPVSYGTASNQIHPNFHLGSKIDAESSGRPSASADGDGAGDDGVVFAPTQIIGRLNSVDVEVTNLSAVSNPVVNAWFDWNQDGDFEDAGEYTISADVASGINSLIFRVPNDALVGQTFARFRLTDSQDAAGANGGAGQSGEVEDYLIYVSEDSAVAAANFDPGANIGPISPYLFFGDASGLLFASGDYAQSSHPVTFWGGSLTDQEVRQVAVNTSGRADIIGMFGNLAIMNARQPDGSYRISAMPRSGGPITPLAAVRSGLVNQVKTQWIMPHPSGDFFLFAGQDAFGLELWRSDGTPTGTSRIADLAPGSANGVWFNNPTFLGDELYFYGPGFQLWKSDGTAGGTKLVSSEVTSIRDMVMFDGAIYFTGGGASGNGLWRSDGTPGGTKLVVEETSDTYFRDVVTDGTKLHWVDTDEYSDYRILTLNDAGDGAEIVFQSSGTPTDGRQVLSLTPASDGVVFWEFERVSFGGSVKYELYFAGPTGVVSLYHTDVTTLGPPVVLKGHVIWTSYDNDPESSPILWRTDLQGVDSPKRAVVSGRGPTSITGNGPNYGRSLFQNFATGYVDANNRLLFGLKGTTHPASIWGVVESPRADVGADAFVNEGSVLILDGTVSVDSLSSENTYEWDFDFDGITFDTDATGQSPVFSATDGPGQRTFALRVTDHWGNVSIDTSVVTINNLAPVISGLADTSTVLGQQINLSATVTDAGVNDSFTTQWNLGDGTIIDDVTQVWHTFENEGEYFASLTATDSDGAVTVKEFRVVVGPPVMVTASASELAEGDSVTLTASLDSALSEDVVIPLTYSGAALADTDFNEAGETIAPTSITISAGQLSASVVIINRDDSLDEHIEEMIVHLGVPSNASLASPDPIVVSLLDNDSEPTAYISSDPQLLDESVGSVPLVVSLSEPSGRDVVVRLEASGSATNESDYTLSDSLLVIPAGETAVETTLRIVDDNLGENVEQIIVEISSSQNATVIDSETYPADILYVVGSNDAPTIEFLSTFKRVSETVGAYSIDVVLSNPSQDDVSFDYSILGSAVEGSDFDLLSPNPTLTIASGELSKTINFQIMDNASQDSYRYFTARLLSATNALLGPTRYRSTQIVDDESLEIRLSASNSSIWEDDGQFSVTASLNAPAPSSFAVPFDLDGKAIEGTHYFASNTVFEFGEGDLSATVTFVLAADDAIHESNRSVELELAKPAEATLRDSEVQVTIRDNDPYVATSVFSPWGRPRYHRYNDRGTVNESDGSEPFTVYLSQATNHPVVVPLEYTLGSAEGNDFSRAVTSITIPAGRTRGTADISITDDGRDEPAESFRVTIGDPVGAVKYSSRSSFSQRTITIIDNDAPPNPYWVFPETVVREGDTPVVAVGIRLAGTAETTVTATVNTGGTATRDQDYFLPEGDSVTFEPGIRESVLLIGIVDDGDYDGLETIDLHVDTGGGRVSTFTINLNDNDSEPRPPRKRQWWEKWGDEGQKVLNQISDGLQQTADMIVDSWVNSCNAMPQLPNPFNPGQLLTICSAAHDGYFDGATVFVDYNFNEAVDFVDLDANGIESEGDLFEQITLSGYDGSFTAVVSPWADMNNDGRINHSEAQLVAYGGTDVSTGFDARVPLTAPLHYPAITPITTLVAKQLFQTDEAIEVVEERIAAALSLPSINYLAADLIAVANQGDSFAADAFSTSVQIYSTVQQIASYVSALPAGPAIRFAGSLAFSDMASKLREDGAVLDLTESLFVESLLQGTLIRSGLDEANVQTAQDIASVIVASNAAIASAVGATGRERMEAVVQVQAATTNGVANLLSEFGGGELSGVDLISQTTGASLQALIDESLIGNVVAPYIVADDVTIVEGDDGTTVAVFDVALTDPSNLPVSVQFTTSDFTASAGEDYVNTSGQLTWQPGETTVHTIAVPIIGDTLGEADERFYLILTDAVNAQVLETIAFGDIVSDDAVTISVGDNSIDHILTLNVSEDGTRLFDNGVVAFEGVTSGDGAFVIEAVDQAQTDLVATILPDSLAPTEGFRFIGSGATSSLTIDASYAGAIEHVQIDDLNGSFVIDGVVLRYQDVGLINSPVSPTLSGLPGGDPTFGDSITLVGQPPSSFDPLLSTTEAWTIYRDEVELSSSEGNSTSLAVSEVGTYRLTYTALQEGRTPAVGSFEFSVTNSPPITVDDSFSANEDTKLFESAGSGLLANDSDSTAGPIVVSSVEGRSILADQPFEFASATLDPSIPYLATSINDTNYYGVRFEVTETVDINRVGGNFQFITGTGPFAAIVQLDGPSDFPDSENLTTPDVLETTLVPLAYQQDGDRRGDIDVTLQPGWYAVMFGTGAFGSTGITNLLLNNVPNGNQAFIHAQPTVPRFLTPTVFSGIPNARFVIEGTTAQDAPITLDSGAIVTVASDGSFTYDPNGQFESLVPGTTAIDSFTYTVTDSAGLSAQGTATITIEGVNDAPIARDDSYVVSEELLMSPASSVGVLVNDTDVDGSSLSLTQINGQPFTGLITLASGATIEPAAEPNRFVYDPRTAFDNLSAGQTGSDSFTYTIADEGGQTASANVSITINGVNDVASIAGTRELSVGEDADVIVGSLSIADVDLGEAFFVPLNDVPGSFGTFSIDEFGNWIYDLDNPQTNLLNLNDNPVESFTVASFDGSASTTVAITILGGDDNDTDGIDDNVESAAGDGNRDGVDDSLQDYVASLPNAANQTYVTVEADPTAQLVDVVATELTTVDIAPPADVEFPIGFIQFGVTVATPGDASEVTLWFDESQAFNAFYKFGKTDLDPEPNFYEFTYDAATDTGAIILPDRVVLRLRDGGRGDADGEANGVIRDPFALALATRIGDDIVATQEDTPLTILPLRNDVASGPLTIVSVSEPEHGYAVAQEDGSIVYTPDANSFGEDSFTYEVIDSLGTQGTATIRVTVTPVNDPASITGDLTGTMDEDRTIELTGQVTIADVDPGEAAVVPSSGIAGVYGTLELESDGRWSYLLDNTTVQGLAPGTSVDDSFTVTSVDGTAGVPLTITIEGRNDAPTLTVGDALVTVDEGTPAMNQVAFADIDSPVVTLEATIGHVTVDDQGNWIWSYPAADGPDDSQTVTIRAIDDYDLETTVSFELVVVNQAPELTLQSISQPRLEGTPITVQATASDAGDGADTLRYSYRVTRDVERAYYGDNLVLNGDFQQTPPLNWTGQNGQPYEVFDAIPYWTAAPVAAFLVEQALSYRSVASLSDATAVLDGRWNWAKTTVERQVINFVDTGDNGRFGEDQSFPLNTPWNDDNFAVRATGLVEIPEDGTWTFGTSSDDGVSLRVGDSSVIWDDTLHGPEDRFGSISLAAGLHPIELIYFERRGGAEVEIFAAPGDLAAWDPRFRLIGDTASGGLPVWSPSSIEIQAGDHGSGVADGNQVTELDLPDGINDASPRRIEQQVTIADTGAYRLSLDVARRNSDPQANGVRVLIDGQLVDTIQPTANQLVTYSFDLSLDAGEHTIAFEGVSNTIYGSVIDNISLRQLLVQNETLTVAEASDIDSSSFDFVPDDDGTYLIQLAVRDDDGALATVLETIVVDNVAPQVVELVSSHASLAARSTDGSVTVTGSLFDPGIMDTHRVVVAWGDGTVDEIVVVEPEMNAFTASHTYLGGGVYDVLVTVYDNRDATAIESTTSVVEGVGLIDGTLYLIGTDGTDSFEIRERGGDLQVDYRLAGERPAKVDFDANAVHAIIVHSFDGNDRIDIDYDGDVPVTIDAGAGNDRIETGGTHDLIFAGDGNDRIESGAGDDIVLGGDGNDRINAGRGNDIVSGAAGNDRIWGGDGRDVLIGGDGRDRMDGDDGDDLLFGGVVALDQQATALQLALIEWNNLGNVDAALAMLGDLEDDDDRDTLDGGRGEDELLEGV